MTSRTRLVDRGAVGARPYRGPPRLLARAHDVVHPARLGAGVADADRAGHVGAVAVDDATEVDDHELVAARCARSYGRAWGFDPFGPEATMGSKLTPLAPRRRISNSSASATSRSVGRSAKVGVTAASASSAMAHAAWMRATSPGVLHPPQLLDEVLGRHQLGVGEPFARERPLLRPGDAVSLEARGGRSPAAASTSRGPLVGLAGADLDAGVDPGRRQLLRRLLGVAAVGDEDQFVRLHEEERRRAR